MYPSNNHCLIAYIYFLLGSSELRAYPKNQSWLLQKLQRSTILVSFKIECIPKSESYIESQHFWIRLQDLTFVLEKLS